MAQVTGRPGYAALCRTRDELESAHVLVDAVLRPGGMYRESDLAYLCETLAKPLSWVRGAEGECRTARVLNSLPDEYVVYHDFHVRRSDGRRENWNIDHIVLGPSGVFVIDSKNHRLSEVPSAASSELTQRNVLSVFGQAMDVRDWVRGRLTDDSIRLFVRGVVVYAQPEVHVEKLDEKQVWVLPLELLAKRLTRLPSTGNRLCTADIAAIRHALNGKRALTPTAIG